MIFLSAQPDEYYFLWQLQLQIFNFKNLGIEKGKIHILIGYNLEKGLSSEFTKFISQNNEASFYCYPDEREHKLYSSSIRPHIITKHFERYPALSNESVFYHDSDILFESIPDFDTLNDDEIWYVSDARSYIGSNFIKRVAGTDLFYDMCKVVDIDYATVEENEENAGGAQYLLKNCHSKFWKKIEADSEKLYKLLLNHSSAYGYCENKDKTNLIQPWCADMWALWWNALLFGFNVKINSELNFSWASSRISEFNHPKILHYTGRVKREAPNVFRKENYIHYSPFNDDLTGIDNKTSSVFIKDLINSYKKAQQKNRIDLQNVSFLIPVRIDSIDRLENINAIVKYLQKLYVTNIFILEADRVQKIRMDSWDEKVKYSFVYDENPKLHCTKYFNQLLAIAQTPYVALYDADVIIPESQITQAIAYLKTELFSIVSPYNGAFLNVDSLLKAMFIKLNDAELFEANIGKMEVVINRSYGGVVFLNRTVFINAGMENENISSWGPNDLERVKRMNILGNKLKRVDGNLYHLHHTRGLNSSYENSTEKIFLTNEYIKVSSMRKEELTEYIQSWTWLTKNHFEINR